MATQFFDQLAGPLSNLLPSGNWYSRTVKYGIKCDATITRDDSVKSKSERRGATFTNVLSTFGHFKVNMVDDMFITDGINVKMLNDYGRLDYQMVMEQLKLWTPYRPNVCNDLAMAVSQNQQENHVAILLNLLRWWVIKSGKKEDMTFSQDDLFYDDGHVSMTYKQYLQSDFGGDIEPVSGRSPNFVQFGENVVIGESFYMPNILGFTERDLMILSKYCGELTCKHPSRLAFSTPQLVDNIHIPYETRIPTVNPYAMAVETSDDLWQVMSKYVFANRCQTQFDLAYSIVVMTMYAPLPRSVEANAWVSPANIINVPKLGSIRGILPIFTGGQGYSSRPEAEVTWHNFKDNRNRIFVHGIAACEAMFAGIFEILTSGGDMLTSLFDTMGVTSASSATPWRLMQECAAYRFGKGFETTWETRAGPELLTGVLTDSPVQRDIFVTGISDLTGYETYKVDIDGIEHLRIRSSVIRPAVFPVLSYGICDDRYYLNKKSYNAEMNFRPELNALVSGDANSVNKMMCIMRIAGLDCSVTDKMTNKVSRNWAANSNGQVMPIFNPYNMLGAYVMPVSSIAERKKCWMRMDPVETKLKLGVDISVRSYVVFSNGREVGLYNRRYTPVVRVPKAMSKEHVSSFIVKTGSQASPYTYQDFLMAVTSIPVMDPTPALVSLATEVLQSNDILQESDGLTERVPIEMEEV